MRASPKRTGPPVNSPSPRGPGSPQRHVANLPQGAANSPSDIVLSLRSPQAARVPPGMADGRGMNKTMNDGHRASPLRVVNLPRFSFLNLKASKEGREYLALGYAEAALAECRKANDVVGWAAYFCLYGNPASALKLLDTYITAACLMVCAHRDKVPLRVDYETMSEMLRGLRSASSIEEMLGVENLTFSDRDVSSVAVDLGTTLPLREIHRWYTIALLTSDHVNIPPHPSWMYHFLVVAELYLRGNVPTRAHVEERLLARCANDSDAMVVDIVANHITHRYRAALRHATTFLRSMPDDLTVRFIRLRSALHLGEVGVALRDAAYMSQCHSRFSCAVGIVLTGVFAANGVAFRALRTLQLTQSECCYLSSISHWAHAHLLMMLNQFEEAQRMAEMASRSSSVMLKDHLMLINCVCSIALNDQAKLASLQLPAVRQLHLALIPKFGGGLDNNSIEAITASSDIGKTIDPRNVRDFSDARVVMVLHFLIARRRLKQDDIANAWQSIVIAADAAKEILGSAEFCMSDGAPHNVLLAGVSIGMTYVDQLVEDESPSPETQSTLCDDIVLSCREWSHRLRMVHRSAVFSMCANIQVSIAEQDPHSVFQAVALAERYPDSILALNLATLALHSKILVQDAQHHARRTLNRYPHVPEVRAMYEAVTGESATYTTEYRWLLPLPFSDHRHASFILKFVRPAVVMLLILAELALLALFLGCSIELPLTSTHVCPILKVPSVVPSAVGVAHVVYALFAVTVPVNLVTHMMRALHVRDTPAQRFRLAIRGIAVCNVVSALLVVAMGSQFTVGPTLGAVVATGIFTAAVPMLSRLFALESRDEPNATVAHWMTIFFLDVLATAALLPLHTAAVVLEPAMFAVFFFFRPAEENASDVPTDVMQRIRRHAATNELVSYGQTTRFWYLRFVECLYARTHSNLETRYAFAAQRDEESRAVFPLVNSTASVWLTFHPPMIQPPSAALELPPPRADDDPSLEGENLSHDDKSDTLGNIGEALALNEPVRPSTSIRRLPTMRAGAFAMLLVKPGEVNSDVWSPPTSFLEVLTAAAHPAARPLTLAEDETRLIDMTGGAPGEEEPQLSRSETPSVEEAFLSYRRNMDNAGAGGSFMQMKERFVAARRCLIDELTSLEIIPPLSVRERTLMESFLRDLMQEGDGDAEVAALGQLLRWEPVASAELIPYILSSGQVRRSVLRAETQFVELMLSLPEILTKLSTAQCHDIVDGAMRLQDAVERLEMIYLLAHAARQPSNFQSPSLSAVWQRAVAAALRGPPTAPPPTSVKFVGARGVLLDELQRHPTVVIHFDATEGTDGHTILSRACSVDDARLIGELIARDFLTDPNTVLSDGRNALIVAVQCNAGESVRKLTQHRDIAKSLHLPFRQFTDVVALARATPHIDPSIAGHLASIAPPRTRNPRAAATAQKSVARHTEMFVAHLSAALDERGEEAGGAAWEVAKQRAIHRLGELRRDSNDRSTVEPFRPMIATIMRRLLDEADATESSATLFDALADFGEIESHLAVSGGWLLHAIKGGSLKLVISVLDMDDFATAAKSCGISLVTDVIEVSTQHRPWRLPHFRAVLQKLDFSGFTASLAPAWQQCLEAVMKLAYRSHLTLEELNERLRLLEVMFQNPHIRVQLCLRREGGEPLLFLAVENDDAALISIAARAAAVPEINVKSSGETVLHRAIRLGAVASVKALLEVPGILISDDDVAVAHVSENGDAILAALRLSIAQCS